MTAGDRIEDTGMLVRDGGGFVLKRDVGGRLRLDLARMPVDEIEKHVCVTGVWLGPDHVEVAGIRIL